MGRKGMWSNPPKRGIADVPRRKRETRPGVIRVSGNKLYVTKGRTRRSNFWGVKGSGKTREACFVATAVYGDSNHPCVCILRTFRDESLRFTVIGTVIIQLYYFLGPILAYFVSRSETIRRISRRLLDDIVKYLLDQ